MFEVDKVPDSWINVSHKCDLTLVPNKFCYNTWVNSGAIPEKLGILPLGVDTDLFTPDTEPLDLVDTATGKKILDTYDTRILIVQEISNRKNLLGALKTIFRTFDDLDSHDSSCVILKSSSYTRVTDISKTIFMLKRTLQASKELKKDLSKYHVFIYPQILPIMVVPKLFTLATHYFSMSFGEGTDMNCLQAMASGKPCVIPEHTGYLGYCTPDNSFLIPIARKEHAIQDGAVQGLYAGAHWLVPDEARAVDTLKVALSSKGIAQEKATEALTLVRDKYTWSIFCNGLVKAIESII
jgi:glycosyltransferase involved in cell wall biosynthesis